MTSHTRTVGEGLNDRPSVKNSVNDAGTRYGGSQQAKWEGCYAMRCRPTQSSQAMRSSTQ